MKPKEKPILASGYDLTSVVAEAVGLARTTLQSAIDRGDVQSVSLAGGTPIVSIESARAWSANRPKRGPKPRPE
jgi:hypothetical protein